MLKAAFHYKLQFVENIILFSFTISYARFRGNLRAPYGFSKNECDWCVNTIYVRPSDFSWFECKDGEENTTETFKDFYVVVKPNHREGHTELVFQELKFAGANLSSEATPTTPVGMMCKCFFSYTCFGHKSISFICSNENKISNILNVRWCLVSFIFRLTLGHIVAESSR